MLRPWQLDIVRIVWGPDRPKLSALAIGRGNAKSTLAAAMALYRLYQGDDETIDILAGSPTGWIGKICAKFVARHEQLEKRAAVFADRIAVGQVLEWLPADAAALEGRTPTLVICDEGGRITGTRGRRPLGLQGRRSPAVPDRHTRTEPAKRVGPVQGALDHTPRGPHPGLHGVQC